MINLNKMKMLYDISHVYLKIQIIEGNIDTFQIKRIYLITKPKLHKGIYIDTPALKTSTIWTVKLT